MKDISRAFAGREVEERTKETWRAFVGPQDIPIAIHDDGGVRFMLGQNAINRASYGGHLRGVPGAFKVNRGVAGSEQEDVSFTKRNVQRLRQTQQHLPAGNAATAFDEADVALRYARVQR